MLTVSVCLLIRLVHTETVSYSISLAADTSVDESAFSLPPIVVNAILLKPASCESACNDGNPCTSDRCIGEECVNFLQQDNFVCGYGMTCEAGVCQLHPITKVKQAGFLPLDLLLTLLVIYIGVVVGYILLRKK